MGDASDSPNQRRAKAARRRRPWRRRLLWAGAVLVVLALLLFVAAFLVSKSSLPRRVVEDQLEKLTGLRFEIAELEVGWFGPTRASEVVVTLPLEDAPIAVATAANVDHGHLLLSLLLRSFQIDRIELLQPTVYARRSEAGSWNIADALARISGRNAGGGNGSSDLPDLPVLDIDEALIEVWHGEEHVQDLVVSLAGRSPRALEYDAALTVQGVGEAGASFAVGAEWRHVLQANIESIQPLLTALGVEGVEDLEAALEWRGRFERGGSLAGRLRLDNLATERVQAEGLLNLAVGDAGLIVQPRELRLDPAGADDLAPVTVRSGEIRLRGDTLRLDKLALAMQHLDAELSGAWSLENRRGEAQATWNVPADRYGPMRHHGSATMTAALERAGRIQLQAEVDGEGRGGGQAYDAEATLLVRGPNLDELHVRLAFPDLRYRDDAGAVSLSGLELEADRDGEVIRLNSLDVPQARATFAEGSYHLDTQAWSLLLEAERLDLPRVDLPELDVALESSGRGSAQAEWQASAVGDRYKARTRGRYDVVEEKPLEATASVEIALMQHAADAATEDEGRWTGASTLELDVAGTLQPFALAGRAQVTGERLRYGDADLGDLGFEGDVNVRGGGFDLATDEFELLEGACLLRAERAGPQDQLRVSIDCKDAQLGRVAELLQLDQEVSGRVDAALTARLQGTDLAEAHVEGGWQVTDLQAGDFAADSAEGEVTAEEGTARLTILNVQRNGGRITGEASFDLRGGRELTTDVTATDWPVMAGDLELKVGGEAKGKVDVADFTARGDVQLESDLRYRGRDIGRIRLAGKMEDRTLTLDDVELETGGGSLRGGVTLPLDQWTEATGNLRADAIDLQPIAASLGLEDALRGTASGTISAKPATDPRAFAPLAVQVDLEFEDATYRGLDLTTAELLAYVGRERSVLDTGAIHAVGGRIDLWASTNMHEADRYVQAHARLQNLKLGQIVNAVREQDEPIPGRVSGQLSGAGYTQQPHRLFGKGQLELTNSDLVKLPVVDVLYGALKIASGRDDTGSGTARLSLTGETLELTSLRYFNRGVEVILRGEAFDISEGGDSVVSGVGIGFIRPLQDVDLPLADYLDRLFAGAQTGAASVQVSGTLAEPQANVVPLADVRNTLERMFGVGGD